jgi:hypothetical protein
VGEAGLATAVRAEVGLVEMSLLRVNVAQAVSVFLLQANVLPRDLVVSAPEALVKISHAFPAVLRQNDGVIQSDRSSCSDGTRRYMMLK